MKAKWLIAAAFAAVACGKTSPAGATFVASDDPVLFWNQMLTQNVTGSPVLTSRSYSMVEVAIYDAVNATSGNYSLSYTGIGPSTGDTRAAAATAAHDVLLYVLPDIPANATKRAQIEQSYQDSLNLVAAGQARTDGIATGAAAASAIITNRTGDGSLGPSTYTPTNPPVDGHWQQTTLGAAGAAVAPWWGSVTPWNMNTGDQFRPGPPPDINSPEFAAALAEVMTVGSATASLADRTAFQTQSAQYWATAGNGLAPWINAAIGAAAGQNLTSLQYAEMFALLSTNVADATIGVFDAKYTYDFWRPVTAIHDADPASTWQSLITAPSHPSYISGHSAVGGAAAETLMFLLGSDADACFAGFTCFDSFELAAENGANSRLWGGIHYDFDNDAGLALGHSVGQFGIQSGAFQPVPEPGTWLTMLIGFGFIGLAFRRQRARSGRHTYASGGRPRLDQVA
jgi:hypothetical protein